MGRQLNSLIKLELDNKIRILSFKFRNDISKIIVAMHEEFPKNKQRVTGKYVTRVLEEFKAEEAANSPFVAAWAFEYIIEGIRQRQAEWDEEFALYESKKMKSTSYCCNARAVMHTFELGHDEWLCTNCQLQCRVNQELDLSVMRDIRVARAEKRKDDESLARAIEHLGFGKKSSPVQQTHQILLPNIAPKNQVHKVDSHEVPNEAKPVVEDLRKLNPMDQAVVAGQISQQLDSIISGDTTIVEEGPEDAEETSE